MPTKEETEHAKLLKEINREDAKRAHDANRDHAFRTNEAAVNSANLALRTILIVNGGAAIALLTFIGGLVSNGKLPVGDRLIVVTAPLNYFAWGVALATLSMALGYFTNFSATSIAVALKATWKHPYLEETKESQKWRRLYMTSILLAIGTAFGSLGLFICGMVAVRTAISHL